MTTYCFAICIAVLVLGLALPTGAQSCERCYLCDSRPFSKSWFLSEMICQGACFAYETLPTNNGTVHCATLEGFETCRGKGNNDKCDCIRKQCNGAAADNSRFLSLAPGLILLVLQAAKMTL